MILQRFLDAVLSALGWLVNLLFPRLVLLTVLLCFGFGAFFLAVLWRSRTRVVRAPVRPAVPVWSSRRRPKAR
jgi:hypothetical protein